MSELNKYTASTGFDRNRFHTYINLLRYFRKNQALALHDYREVFLRAKSILNKYLNKSLNRTRILEIGHGQHAAISLLFHNAGVKVTGIDMDYVKLNWHPNKYFKIRKLNGVERALKTLCRNIFFDPQYYHVLNKQNKSKLNFSGLDLRRMDAGRLEFPDNSFDFIFSNAVFEHLKNVEQVCQEIKRVLNNDGIIYLSIDLFPSISGGHNLAWAFPDERASKIVPAWDHLRGHLYPSHVYLNSLKEKDYLSIFNKYFQILEANYIYEGKKYLTPQIEKELAQKGFTREDLLKKTLRVVLKKTI